MIDNDTPRGPLTGRRCGRDGCGHAPEDHWRTRRQAGYGPLSPQWALDAQYGPTGTGPCNVRGRMTHCVCYDYLPREADR